MWCYVMTTLGTPISNASFNFPTANEGSGWYWVQVGDYQNVCASAPGYYSTCGNDGTAPDNNSVYMWFKLAAIPTPPPPPYGNCWSG